MSVELHYSSDLVGSEMRGVPQICSSLIAAIMINTVTAIITEVHPSVVIVATKLLLLIG